MKVSIIVPVYNAQAFIKTCLDSIIAQTFSDIECIIIDGASTDGSTQVIFEYEQTYPHLFTVIYNKKNTGRTKAREAGVKKAKGDFIGFVDADDFIEPTMYEHLYLASQDTNADVVLGGIYNVDVKGNIHAINQFDNTFEKTRKEQMLGGIPSSFCIGIFDRSLFHKPDVYWVDINRGEDLAVVPKLLFYSRKVHVLSKCVYYYRNLIGEGHPSINTSLYKDISYINDLMQVANVLAEFFHDKDCKAIDLCSCTIKFPDFFNRYNYFSVHTLLKKNNTWQTYIIFVLRFIIQYPQYFERASINMKSENKLPLWCFMRIFRRVIITKHIPNDYVLLRLMNKLDVYLRLLLRLQQGIRIPLHMARATIRFLYKIMARH